MQSHRPRREPAGRFDPRPEAAHGAKLGEAEEDVRIGGEQQRDVGPRRIEGQPQPFLSAEVSECGGQHSGEFLRFAGAGLVPGAPIRQERRAGEPRLRSHVEDRMRIVVHGPAMARLPAERVEPDVDIKRRTRQAPLVDETCEGGQSLRRSRPRIEPQADEIELDLIEHSPEGAVRHVQPESAAIGARIAHEHEGVGPTFQVEQGLAVCSLGVGMVDPLRDGPCAGLRPPRLL